MQYICLKVVAWVLPLKSVFLRTYLGKSFDPKIHKNYPIEINEFNGAVLCEFLGQTIFSKHVHKKQTLYANTENEKNYFGPKSCSHKHNHVMTQPRPSDPLSDSNLCSEIWSHLNTFCARCM